VTLAPYLQRSLIELVLLAGLAGLLGSWIVLRRLAFFTHAIGTAAFPALVVAGPWGIPAQLSGLGAALGFGGALERLARTRRVDTDAATGLLLVGALALGVVLASDVYHSGAGVDRLLFGSLIALEPSDLWLTAAALAAALLADAALARAWLAGGFDEDAARAAGVKTALADRALVLAVAAAVAVCLSAVGALLVSVVLVVPAATVRHFEPRLRVQQGATVALAAVEGVVAVFTADALDVGPGPAMAVIGAAVFALAAVVR
jgi:ABC-type Mn2+/Zn2+ transport system permease subunit